ncbi:MAG: hypothetical protein HY644_04675 [Acidobacteria bacterium]|nr:hypothetical protein [Acidobacteriota bacterium]
MNRKPIIFMTLTLWVLCAAWAQQPSNFLSYMVIGDSLTAGLINGSLNGDGQKSAFPVLLSAQMRTSMFVPLIAKPGIPYELELVSTVFPPDIRTKAGVSSGRVFPLLMATNLAVPGHTTRDTLTMRPRPPLTDPTTV